MKKKVSMALIVLFIASASSWAWKYPAQEGTVIGTGLGVMLLPVLLDTESDGSYDYWYWIGGGIALTGLIWMIIDISSGDGGGVSDDRVPDSPEDFSHRKKGHSIVPEFLRHIAVGVTPQAAFIGASFRL